MRRRGLWLLCAALIGCVAAPLGDDFGTLPPAAQDERALAALEELFQGEGSGAALDGRTVEQVDLAGITYRTDAGSSRLRWQDVASVNAQTVEELPGRPETIRLYVQQESDSERDVLDLQDPLLAATGLVQRYLILRQRPRFSRVRLLAALDHVRRRREQQLVAKLTGTAPVSTPTTAASPAPAVSPEPHEEQLSSLEAKLRELKEWHEQGLITKEEYDQKRRELLDGM